VRQRRNAESTVTSAKRFFRGALRPQRLRITLRHHPQQRSEENYPQDPKKYEYDQDCRHSLKEEFSQLVNNFLHLVV